MPNSITKNITFMGLMAMLLIGCLPGQNNSLQMNETTGQITASLPDLGAAPELTNDTWLNVDAPLRLANLRGKVVIIDMWTFG
jgi:hypothetical protein